MDRRVSKLTPDNYLKKLILNAVELERHKTEDIIEYVLNTPYTYIEENGEETENFYAGGVGGVRTGITAMKKAGYLTLYPKDEFGNPLRMKQKRPYSYFLTVTGRIHSENPFIKTDHREQRISNEADRLMWELIEDEPAFQRAVADWVDKHEQKKIQVNYQKAPIVRFNRAKTEKIIIENSDGTEEEVTTEQLMSTLQDVTVNMSRIAEMNQTIIAQQWEMAGYEQQIADMYYALDKRNISLDSIKRKNVGSMRIAQRKDLVYAVSSYNPNELEYEMPTEIPVGADFFNAWGNIWGRKVKGATLFNRSSFELMADTNPEVKRGHANHELSYSEMDSIGMFISKIRRTGITVDAVNERMLKPVALVW